MAVRPPELRLAWRERFVWGGVLCWRGKGVSIEKNVRAECSETASKDYSRSFMDPMLRVRTVWQRAHNALPVSL